MLLARVEVYQEFGKRHSHKNALTEMLFTCRFSDHVIIIRKHLLTPISRDLDQGLIFLIFVFRCKYTMVSHYIRKYLLLRIIHCRFNDKNTK